MPVDESEDDNAGSNGSDCDDIQDNNEEDGRDGVEYAVVHASPVWIHCLRG